MAVHSLITLDCGDLQVVLRYENDRWQHAVGLQEAGEVRLLAHSVEGRQDDLWPPSPAFQELHVEERAERRVTFLTGMAGSSHWSASITCDPARNLATFDVACRCKQTPTWLGSLYQVAESVSVDSRDSIIELKVPDSNRRLVLESGDLLGASPDSSGGRENPWAKAIQEKTRALQEALFVAPAVEGVGTVRWTYSLQIAGD